jgi:ferredoxin
MNDDLYEKLRQSIDKFGIGFSATKSGVEIKLLKKLFNEEEARMYMHLTEDLETPEAIAERANQDPEKVAAILKRMTEKGLTFPKRKGDMFYYAAAPFAHGIIENQLKRMDKEFAQLFEEFKFAEQIQKGPVVERKLEFAMPLRIVPVMEPVKTSRPIAAYEDAREIIKSRNRIALAKCMCAEQQRLLETGCEQPLEVCLLFGFYAEYYVEMGMGRWITQEEAFEVLKKAEEAGLVHQPSNNLKPDALCNCCWNCCGLLQHIKQMPNPAEIVASNYFAQVDPELCNACETCVDRCPTGAAAMGMGDVAEINLDRCIGCGLCVSACPDEALMLVSKSEENRQEPPLENLFMKTSEKYESRLE